MYTRHIYAYNTCWKHYKSFVVCSCVRDWRLSASWSTPETPRTEGLNGVAQSAPLPPCIIPRLSPAADTFFLQVHRPAHFCRYIFFTSATLRSAYHDGSFSKQCTRHSSDIREGRPASRHNVGPIEGLLERLGTIQIQIFIIIRYIYIHQVQT